ncbi:MAG TPA: metallophosphoesterase family protein [Pirellulaceae bacterium]|nr:metallophosphoesterase family protein [Pirellulaceae bacterium]
MPRHLVIGDIHGCFDALRQLCKFVRLQSDDVVITLGDYCNRGPNTCAMLDWLIHCDGVHALKPLRGNHDIMMLNARNSESEYRKWMDVGGDATLRSYAPFENDPGTLADVPDHHWRFLADRLLPYFETDTHFFVHANAYPDISLDEQPDFMLYWEQFNDPPRHESGKTMICGHTSQKTGLPLSSPYAVCVDTWACGNGWLTCLHVESGKIWQANQRGETRQLWLDELREDDAK